MDEWEVVISEALRVEAAGAAEVTNLLDAVGQRLRRRVVAAQIATAAAVAVVLGVAGLAIATRSLHPSQRDSTSVVVAGDAAKEGSQPVSYHGLEIYVPRSWAISPSPCSKSGAGSVILNTSDGAGTSCPSREALTGTSVALAAVGSPSGDQWAQLAQKATTVDGHPARRGSGQLPGSADHIDVLVVPDPGVVVSVHSSDEAITERIFGTAKVVQTDSAGCVAHVSALTPAAPTRRSGGMTQLVPGVPTAASLCRYSNDWIARSLTLTPLQRDSLRRTLNGLEPGTTQPDARATASSCEQDRERGFVAIFNYAVGPPIAVTIHIGGCDPLDASNGTRTTVIDWDLIQSLTSLCGYDGGFPNLQGQRGR